MEIKEFVDKINLILCNKFGYVFSKQKNLDGSYVDYAWTFDFDKNKCTCPSDLTVRVFAEEINLNSFYHSKAGKIDLHYISVIYHISPTGNNSLTSKPFEKTITPDKLDKFNFEHLYVWAEGQKATFNNYTQILKMKDIDKRIKELNKDFKKC